MTVQTGCGGEQQQTLDVLDVGFAPRWMRDSRQIKGLLVSSVLVFDFILASGVDERIGKVKKTAFFVFDGELEIVARIYFYRI